MFIDNYVLIAVVCAVAGCLIRYVNQYKTKGAIKISYLICDILTAAFLGYLAYWVIADYGILKPSYASVVTCFIGNMGSRVFDILSWYMHTRLGMPNFKYNKERGQDVSTKRNEKQ